MTLKARILISIIALQLGGYFVLGAFNDRYLRAEQSEALTQEVKQTLHNASDRINNSYLTLQDKALDINIFISTLLYSIESRPIQDSDVGHVKKAITSSIEDIEAIARVEVYLPAMADTLTNSMKLLAVSNASGSSAPSINSLNSHNWPADVDFMDRKFWLSSPYHNIDGVMVISVVRRIIYNDRSVGMVRIDWNLNAVARYLKTIDLSRNSFNFLLDKESKLILTYLDNEIRLAQPLYNNVYIRNHVDLNIANRVDVLKGIDILDLYYDIYYVGTNVGLVFGVVIPEVNIAEKVSDVSKKNVFLAIIIVVVFTLISGLLVNQLFYPISKIVDKIKSSIKDDGDGQLKVTPIEYSDINEFSAVVIALNSVFNQVNSSFDRLCVAKKEIEDLNSSLDLKVLERTEELNAKSKDLEKYIERLKLTQSELIESEKMASLGGLVAGVSHEINTPIGIAVTAITHLKSSIAEVSRKFEDKTLCLEDFDKFRQSAMEGADIIEKNLSRAADLIRSFKMVAVDQSTDEIRDVRMLEYTLNVLNSLKPETKKAKLYVDVDIDPKLSVNLSPGAYSQVLTILVQNTIIHGLEGRSEGHAKIEAVVAKTDLVFSYSDDGVGMTESQLVKLFDPFYTTKRGTGGSGLGAHILYNIVTQSFSGTIFTESLPGNGLRYLIKIPIQNLTKVNSNQSIDVLGTVKQV